MAAAIESAGRCNASSSAPMAICDLASLSSCPSDALLNSSCALSESGWSAAPA